MNHPEFGHDLVAKFKSDLQEVAIAESEAKLIGKRLMITFTPSKKKVTNNEETKQ